MEIITELDRIRDDTEALWARIRKIEQSYDMRESISKEEEELTKRFSVVITLFDAILILLP